MINYSLSLLAALGAARLLQTRSPRLPLALLTFALFLQGTDGALYQQHYLNLFPVDGSPDDPRSHFYNREDFAASSVFQYRDRFLLSRSGGAGAVPTSAFLVKLPPPRLDSSPAEGGEETNEEAILIGAGSPRFEAQVELQAGLAGVEGWVESIEPGLLVIPLNRSLGAAAFLDDQPVSTRTINGALTALAVESGRHRVELRVAHDLYLVAFLAQWAIFIYLGGLFLSRGECRDEKKESPPRP